ncbi:MAG: glycosyltransferase, partial [Pyrinomonadaceae bacterium]
MSEVPARGNDGGARAASGDEVTKVAIITGGSRDDVQPLLALGVGLRDAGHRVRFCTHPLFNPLVSGRGLEFFSMVGNDPRAD